MTSQPPRDFLTVAELAELLRVSRRKAYELVNRGEIPSVRIGGSLRIPQAELREHLAASTTGRS